MINIKNKLMIYALLIVTIILISTGCSEQSNNEKIIVAVSIAPQEAFVKAVAGDLVEVVTLIPPGASPTNYQPSPKQMSDFYKAEIYYSIGVPTEEGNILPMIKDMSDNIRVVYLNDIVAKEYAARYFDIEDKHEETSQEGDDHDEDHQGRDPHIWLSPKRVIVIVEEIVNSLSEIDAKNSDIYIKNGKKYIEKLIEIDQQIIDIVKDMENKEFIIMHPSLGYFADDYGLTMIAIEKDGKASNSAHLQNVIDYAKGKDISVIFYQAEFDSSQAKIIAEEINGEVVELDTLSSDYLINMEKIVKALKEGQEKR